MLKKLFSNPLELKIGGQSLQFKSESDFAFILDGRTAVSSEKLANLFKLPIDQLEAQAKKVLETKQSLYVILTQAVDDPTSIDRSIRELDTMTFSGDNGWRDIIKALNEADEEFNPMRTSALSKYIKYLSSLETIIEHILLEKKRVAGSANEEVIDFAATWASNDVHVEAQINSEKKANSNACPKISKCLCG